MPLMKLKHGKCYGSVSLPTMQHDTMRCSLQRTAVLLI